MLREKRRERAAFATTGTSFVSTGGRLIVSGVVQFRLPKIRYFAIEPHPFLASSKPFWRHRPLQSAKQALLRKLQTLGREYGRGGGGA